MAVMSFSIDASASSSVDAATESEWISWVQEYLTTRSNISTHPYWVLIQEYDRQKLYVFEDTYSWSGPSGSTSRTVDNVQVTYGYISADGGYDRYYASSFLLGCTEVDDGTNNIIYQGESAQGWVSLQHGTNGIGILASNFEIDTGSFVYQPDDEYIYPVTYDDSTLSHVDSFDGSSIMLSVTNVDADYTSMSVRAKQLDITGTYVLMNEEYTGAVQQLWPFYSDVDGYDSELPTEFTIDYFVEGELVHEQSYLTTGYELVYQPPVGSDEYYGSTNPNFEYNFYGTYFTITSLVETYEGVTVTHVPMGSSPQLMSGDPSLVTDTVNLPKGVEVPISYGDYSPVFNDKYSVTLVKYGLLSTKVLDKFVYEYGVTTGGSDADLGWYDEEDFVENYDWLTQAKQFIQTMEGLVSGFFSLMAVIVAIAYGFPLLGLILSGLTAYINIRIALWLWSLVKP